MTTPVFLYKKQDGLQGRPLTFAFELKFYQNLSSSA